MMCMHDLQYRYRCFDIWCELIITIHVMAGLGLAASQHFLYTVINIKMYPTLSTIIDLLHSNPLPAIRQYVKYDLWFVMVHIINNFVPGAII
jgi:hypothetical protein